MEEIFRRLEAVTGRLEETEKRLAGSSAQRDTHPSGSSTLASSNLTPVKGGDAGVAAFEDVLTSVNALTKTGNAIGEKVAEVSKLVLQAFKAQQSIIQAVANCQQPSNEELKGLLQPVAIVFHQIDSLANEPRATSRNHAKAASEALQSLNWVCYSGPNSGLSPPPRHVEDSWASAEFWGNKILTEHRGSDIPHVSWFRELKACIMQLKSYVSKYHARGPSWQASGIKLSEYQAGKAKTSTITGSSATQTSAIAAQGTQAKLQGLSKQPEKPKSSKAPKAPPPPPPGSMQKKKESPRPSEEGGMNAVFADINSKGEGVTAGLKKVTDSMKTKNQGSRTGLVSATGRPAGTTPIPSKVSSSGPVQSPRIECQQGKKWIIEHQVGRTDLVIDSANAKQTVYIYKCTQSTIQIKDKVNAIVMDECKKTGVVFSDVVASCELVNCSSSQMQVTGVVPSVVIDKCDNVQVYLSDASLDATITTAKSSAVNLLVPDTKTGDMKEQYIPEQFVSKLIDGLLHTEPVNHGGG